jgi:hypothetical protein
VSGAFFLPDAPGLRARNRLRCSSEPELAIMIKPDRSFWPVGFLDSRFRLSHFRL